MRNGGDDPACGAACADACRLYFHDADSVQSMIEDQPLNIHQGLVPSPRDAAADATVQRVSFESARSLLLTVLGEFVFAGRDPVWTSVLVDVLGTMGIAEKAARQAIARASEADWIQGRKDGRRVTWSLTPRMREYMEAGTRRVRSMSRTPGPWDGRWLVLVLALPESRRALRPKIYRGLGWVGFGNPSPGLWVNPHSQRIDEAHRLIRKFELEDSSVAFVGPSVDLGMTDRTLAERSWDLDRVSNHYEVLLERFGRQRPQSGASLLTAHIQLVHEWQQLPFIDPALPLELLPRGWNGQRTAHRLELLRKKWSKAAHAHWNLLARTTPPR